MTDHFALGVSFYGVFGGTTQERSKSKDSSITYLLAKKAKQAALCGKEAPPTSDGRIIEVN